jgi:orotidine-5'-phosphate decarboxylase
VNFITDLKHRWSAGDSLVCVGLDPEPAKFPASFRDDPDAVFHFCRDIVDATADYACSFKPQIAHFAALGAEDALARLIAHIHASHPGIPVILDSKRGEVAAPRSITRARRSTATAPMPSPPIRTSAATRCSRSSTAPSAAW